MNGKIPKTAKDKEMQKNSEGKKIIDGPGEIYGDVWEKELMKCSKPVLLDMLREACVKKRILTDSRNPHIQMSTNDMVEQFIMIHEQSKENDFAKKLSTKIESELSTISSALNRIEKAISRKSQ